MSDLPSGPRPPSIDEAHAAQFDRALKELGGPVQAALAGLDIEDVPVDLHEMWEAMLNGAQYMQVLGQEIERWIGSYRAPWARERQAEATDA